MMTNGSNVYSRYTIAILCASVVMPLAGCGGVSDVGSVTGTVTLDGQPVPDATVIFQPEVEGPQSTGRTDATGKFELAYSTTGIGAKVGKHKVLITTGGKKPDSSGNLTEVPETIPEKYNAKSELTVEVTPGRNTHDFELTSQ
jgi:hypothetical protein